MTEPTFSTAMERLYSSLPSMYRDADRPQSYVLKRWLAGLGDQQGEVEDLLARIDYNPLDQPVRTTTGEDFVLPSNTWRATGDWTLTGDDRTATVGPATLDIEVFFEGGTYDFTIAGFHNATRGFYDFSVDRISRLRADQYSEVEELGQDTVTGIFLSRGKHVLRFEWDGTSSQPDAVEMSVSLRNIRAVNTKANAAPISDLVDPQAAENEWLLWLAQLVGVRLHPELTSEERRDAIRYAASGFRAGTKRAIADAAKSELSGTRYARALAHSTPDALGTATEWDVTVITRESETADSQAVLDTIIRKGAKPVGVVLHHLAYQATWAAIEHHRPTWDDWDAGDWNNVEEAGLL